MKNTLIRAWIILTFTPAIAALVMRLIWEAQLAYALGTWIIIILLIAAVLGLYAAILYFTFNPDFSKLQSQPFKILFSVILIALIIVSAIHFYRFVPSPEANMPISVPMAIMILISELSGCTLLLYLLWRK
ncbi:MAG: hypothetical protein WCX07_02340 [Dehalococcoidales bacterium]|jgi:hypothetical protein|nr:hypothetical protein [Dehalococcoidales bacterium]NLT27706.1 hypothetical protein [Dehalococcoidales bacterium]